MNFNYIQRGCVALISLTLFACFNANALQDDSRAVSSAKLFFSNMPYKSIKISPKGDFLAVNSDAGDRDRLVVINRESSEVISSFEVGKNKRISKVHWVNEDRFIFQARTRVGLYDNRETPPNLYAADANGDNRRELFSWGRSGFQVLSLLPSDPDHILISRYHFADGGEPKAHHLNINDGRKYYLSDQPSKSQQLFADNRGRLRLSYFYEESDKDKLGEGESTLFYKKKGKEDWLQLNIESFEPGDTLNFVGFSEDDRYAYFFSDMDSKVLEVYKFDTNSGEIKRLTSNSKVDANNVVTGLDGNIVGFEFVPGEVSREYIDSSRSTKLLKSISKAFSGQRVTITSATEDRKKAIISVTSDKNSGEYYLFNTDTLEAKFVAARSPKLIPDSLSEMTPYTFNARDGVELSGYITFPNNGEKQDLPLIVKVHGGPHGVRDYWGYDPENQYLAANGYAVLQVNFRGSGGYGKEFLESGYGEWGRKMQDDVTDATLWAIEKGYADEDRICIYGGSYGGYSALMGVIREPDLYQCAVGYVGVYSLPLMYKDGDIPRTDSGVKYLRTVIGDDDSELRDNSPVYLADKVEVPVFLVHGSEDVRVPMSHFEQLTEAFDKHGVEYKTLVREEGHGFQKEENKFELYPKLIKFFEMHLN